MSDGMFPGARMHRVVLAAAMLGGVVLRLIRFAENRPLWYDEALVAINVGSRDFLALLGPLDFEQMAPGLYLWFLKGLVMAFGMHEWVLRLPSLVAGAGLPLVVWLVGRRVLSERGALTAAVLAAIAPAFVGYSAEAKPYGIDACVTGILLLCALRLNERDDRGRRLAFGVVGLVAIGLSLPSVFVLAGLGVVLLASAWRRRNGSGTAPAAAVIGTIAIWRRRGRVAALILVLPLAVALTAGALSLWPVYQRLALFLTPIGLLWVGAVADLVYFEAPHRRESTLAITALVAIVAWPIMGHPWGPPPEGSRELIADLSRRRASEPVYVLSGGLPTWLFYTTDWNAPESQRLAWYARFWQTRRDAVRSGSMAEDPSTLTWRGRDGLELQAGPTGQHWVIIRGFQGERNPDWGYEEMRRLEAVGAPVAWIYGSHMSRAAFESLSQDIRRADGEVTWDARGPLAALLQVRFAQSAAGNAQ